MDIQDNLAKYKMLTEQLPTLDAVVKSQHSKVVEYDVKNGIGYAVGLLNEERVAVSRSSFSKGTYFPRHEHKENEFFVIFAGKCKIRHNGGETVLGVGDSLMLAAGEGHAAEFLEDTRMICITVPAASGFPSDGRQ